MSRVKVNAPCLIIQPEIGGPQYTFGDGQIAEIHNPVELARVCQLPGVKLLDKERVPSAPPRPSRGRRG